MNAGDYCCYKNNERNLKLARILPPLYLSLKSSLLPLHFLLLISWSSHSDLCEAVCTLTMHSGCFQWFPHVHGYIIFQVL